MNQEHSFVEAEFERTHVLFQRGLVNETALETAERSKLNAIFAVERSEEELERTLSARLRANTALEIGKLELQGRELDLEALTVYSPFDGVLLNFEPKIGDCVVDGSLVAEIYAPTEKNIETFLFVNQLVDILCEFLKNNININNIKVEHQHAMNILETDLRAAHKEEIELLTNTHINETSALTDEFNQVKNMLKDEYDKLISSYNELKQRFLNRESKPEDLERIAKLEKDMIVKDDEIKRVKEEMRYFKLEFEIYFLNLIGFI